MRAWLVRLAQRHVKDGLHPCKHVILIARRPLSRLGVLRVLLLELEKVLQVARYVAARGCMRDVTVRAPVALHKIWFAGLHVKVVHMTLHLLLHLLLVLLMRLLRR